MYTVTGRKLSINRSIISGPGLEFHPDTIKDIFLVHLKIREGNLCHDLLLSLLAKLIEGRDGNASTQAQLISFIKNIISGGQVIELSLDTICIEESIKKIAERYNYGVPVPKGNNVWIWHVKDHELLGPNISMIVNEKREWLSKLVNFHLNTKLILIL